MVRRDSKIDDKHYDTDSFTTLMGAWKLLIVQGTVDAYKYLRSPAGFKMALEPIGAKMDFSDGAEYPTLTCDEVHDALIGGNIDILADKLAVEEKMFLNYIETYNFHPPRERILKVICEEKHIDFDECIDTWHIQPDATGVAYALASRRAPLEGITPVIGIPLRTVAPSTDLGKMRFPAIATKYHTNMVHIHKDSDTLEIYDSVGKTVTDTLEHPDLLSTGMSYVLEGFIEDGLFIASDILCWNDIWLNRRPLHERIKLLWHFFEFTEETYIIKNRDELDKVKDELKIVNFRNLNAPYDPTAYDAKIAHI
jgi:hypothetical protein